MTGTDPTTPAGSEMVTVSLRAVDVAEFLRYRMDLPRVAPVRLVVDELRDAYYEACPQARPAAVPRRQRRSRVYTGWRDR